MPAVKIGPKHQITIPKEVFEKLHLAVGDWIEAGVEQGRILLIPKQLTPKPPVPRLSKEEQQTLKRAKEKIAKIQAHLSRAKGLNNQEIRVALKVGLIDPDQVWWWHEDWQKGEREAEAAIKLGKLTGPFETAEELIKSLKQTTAQ